MIIRKYDIKLIRIKEKDIELIRRKRNSIEINSLMQYRDTIRPEEQEMWFKTVNNIYNNYFIIYHKNKKIGLINGKNCDYKKRQSEGGMFIWDKDYIDTFIPALCSVIMSDFTFLINNFNCSYINILKSNKRAIQHNKLLGYVPIDAFLENKEVQCYVLTKENYLKHIVKLRNGIRIITLDNKPLSIDDIDFSDDTQDDFNLLYKPLPTYIRNTVELILQKKGKRLM